MDCALCRADRRGDVATIQSKPVPTVLSGTLVKGIDHSCRSRNSYLSIEFQDPHPGPRPGPSSAQVAQDIAAAPAATFSALRSCHAKNPPELRRSAVTAPADKRRGEYDGGRGGGGGR